MAVGRAQILDLSQTRKVLHELLARTDAPLPDGGTAPRSLRLKINPLVEEMEPDWVYSEFGPRVANPKPVGGKYDPQVIVTPPIWSFENPAVLTFRKAGSWDLVERRGIAHLVDCVRVKCPATVGRKAAKHTMRYPDDPGLGNLADTPYPWMRYGESKVKGRVATSGSLMMAVEAYAHESPVVAASPLFQPSSPEPLGWAPGAMPWAAEEWLAELLSWRGTGPNYICPEHEVPCEDYPVIHGYAYAFSLFSNTSKMSTLSWSLPAGPPEFGGTCPGAKGMAAMAGAPFTDPGSTTLRPEKRAERSSYVGAESVIKNVIEFRSGTEGVDALGQVRTKDISASQWVRRPLVIQGKEILPLRDVTQRGLPPLRIENPKTGKIKVLKDVVSVQDLIRAKIPFELEVSELRSDFVCDACYALKGNYAYTTQQIGGVMRLFWLEWVLGKRWQPGDPEGGISAGGNPDPAAMAEGVNEMVKALEAAMSNGKLRRSEGHSLTHFRVHDAADFSAAYMVDFWGQVCERLPHILFWFPTRIWQFKNFRKKLQYWVGNPDALADPGVQEWLTQRGMPAELGERPLEGGVSLGGLRAGGPLHNMAVRASGFRFGDDAPMLPDLIVVGSGAGASGDNATWNCPAYLAREATCANAINPWGEAFLRDTTGLSMLEMMQRRAWTVEDRKAYQSSKEIPSSWISELPEDVTKDIKDPIFRITYVKTGPKVRKPGKSIPEYERILRAAVEPGPRGEPSAFQAWLQEQPEWDGSPVTPLECRLCWGGFNFEGRGGSLEPSPLGPMGAVTVTYHEH